jgi:predicted ferric reductase
MQKHPLSLASSLRQPQIELTIKQPGDFTESVQKIEPGTRAWLEGPCGPGELLDSGERLLVKLGVPPRAIFTEGFDMV